MLSWKSHLPAFTSLFPRPPVECHLTDFEPDFDPNDRSPFFQKRYSSKCGFDFGRRR